MTHTPFGPATTPSLSHDLIMPSTALTPILNTPTKLPRFLSYAETHLGVRDVHQYEEKLSAMGFGPDILHVVDDKVLTDIGISLGDTIRIKQHSLTWWNNMATKCKFGDRTPSPSHSPPRCPLTPPQ
jgi:hypothetical protein